jgi:putative aminopeptidase FrvX
MRALLPADQLRLLRRITSLPTAPFCEQAVIAEVRRWADRRGLEVGRDRSGNVLVRYRASAGRGRWVLTAHMDHPGFIVRRRRGRQVYADFRGGVRAACFRGRRVRLISDQGEHGATVRTHRKDRDRACAVCRLELDAPADAPPGSIGMWDLPVADVRGRRLVTRACDDLAGVAVALCALDVVRRRGVETDLTVLLTRAEECGFVGMLGACRDGTLPQSAWVIGIETSKAQPAAPLGGGAVIRVGDRARTFDPDVSAELSAAAGRLGRRAKVIRALMPGGTCETTPLCLWGHRAGAVCLPLEGYHNMSDDGRIVPEQIDLNDVASLVRLLVETVGRAPGSGTAAALWQDRLDAIWDQRSGYLEDPLG